MNSRNRRKGKQRGVEADGYGPRDAEATSATQAHSGGRGSTLAVKILVGLLGALGGAAAIAAVVQSHLYRERDAAARKIPISITPLVQPVPGAMDGTLNSKWETTLIVRNSGRKSSGRFIIQMFLPDPLGMQFESPPRLTVAPPGGRVLTPATSPGLVQIVVEDLLPATGFYVSWFAFPQESKRRLVEDSWKRDMFSPEFANLFISSIGVSGDDVAPSLDGMLEVHGGVGNLNAQ